MPNQIFAGRTLDARPDRIDFRDRVYLPPLIALPSETPEAKLFKRYVSAAVQSGLVLDQLKEGACTGFGLAGMINHMAWRRSLTSKKPVVSVSPRMLYQLARQYDEWPGEDYDGSSCRGAVKGWHRHGVCSQELWPYANKRGEFIKPKTGWEEDAAQRPLGAYYRVDKGSIADLQAAIFEAGAIYVSADVHEGWAIDPAQSLPVIECRQDSTGGHAFALVGYTADGFIVQNSWGRDWGHHGFAVMTYQDWVLHGGDAWVAVLGAPMIGAASARTRSSEALRDRQSAPRAAALPAAALAAAQTNPAVLPWAEPKAYEHTVVLGNNGEPQNRYVDAQNAAAAVRIAAYDLPLAWLKKSKAPRLAIYAHGGLNDEAASIKRIRVLAPYFAANDIYPLFITWRTGVLESIVGMLDDTVEKWFGAQIATGWEWARDQADRAIEALAERALVKPIWVQIKQNAEASAQGGSGLWQVAEHLRTLRVQMPQLEIHLIGHSAGAILLGHLLDLCAGTETAERLEIQSTSLFAPACTINFANRHYLGAAGNGVFSAGALHVDLMSEERERADTVGPYGKSLLYLVSRALESVHKMPLLGMEAAWREGKGIPEDVWKSSADIAADLAQWRTFASQSVPLKVHKDKLVRTGSAAGQSIALAHGSFDNDIDVITAALTRVLGAAPSVPVDNLQAF